MKNLLLIILFTLTLSAIEKPLEKVSLQLMWLDQFQFAGYYMAKEKGFYEKSGLDVEIKKFQHSMDTAEEVLSGRATFGVGRSGLIRLRSEGKEVVLLSAIFQSSPFMLLSLESSNIKSVKDFEGKTLMLTQNAIETASINAMISSSGVDLESMTFKEHTLNFEDLLDSKVDLYAAYTSNEPYILKQRDIPYKIFSPKDEGFDFYSDLLFTSQKEVDTNSKRVDAFKRASLQGWKYAFEHIDETVRVVYKKYNPQKKTLAALTYEAHELKKLAFSDDLELGNISESKLQRIFDVYKIMGLAKNRLDMNHFIFDSCEGILSVKEKNYLKNKKEIKICVLPSSLPYSAIEDGKFIGIGADLLKMISNHISTSFVLVETSSWEESVQKARNRECDLLPVVQATQSRREHLSFTSSYYKDALVIVTDNDKNYIVDIEPLLDEEFSALEGSSFVEILEERYPAIQLNIVASRQEGFEGVQSGKYYGHIDIMMVAAYYMQRHSKVDLKISGQFEDSVKVSFGVRDDDPILFGIFEKIALKLRPEDIQNILNKWVSINYTNGNNHKETQQIFIFVLIFGSIFIYRQYILKKKNRELEELQNKLVELNKSLESKVEDAVSEIVKKDAYLLHQSRLAQMGEILSMIAHQWKQPLSSISTTQIAVRLSLELEKYDLADEKEREDFLIFLHKKLDKIGSDTQNLSQIISDFSDFYKPNKNSEIMLLDNVVVKACNLVEDNMHANGISLYLELDTRLLVNLHENEFMQVVLNILNNAKEQFISKNIKDASIWISSYDEDDFLVLEVRDNAGGIDEEIISNIFDPYFSTKLEKNGTGLGLYMSKKIIEDYHQGKISAINNRDGALFIIKIKAENIEDKDEK